MKKTLSLVLALIMVFGCMLSIAPMAEATDTPAADAPAAKYVPEIAYSNVNYAEGLTIMFAVPAPAAGALEDGASVKVVVWDTESNLYSYNESVATDASAATAISLEADATKATIGGKEYLVFKYNALTADMMTDVIYARAAVVNKDNKAIAYGDVIDYSVVEYVHTAKGNFAGTPALADANVLELLDSLVAFGSLAQIFFGGEEPYAPNGFLADDELHKIWITPVVAGVKQDKVFGGFFKYVEGGYATIRAPHYDGVSVIAYKDKDGNVITDAFDSSSDEAYGFQVLAVNGDINVTIEYNVTPIRSLIVDQLGEGFYVDNTSFNSLQGDPDKLIELGTGFGQKNGEYTMINFKYTQQSSSNLSGLACIPDSAGRMNYYHAAKTVKDPNNDKNLVLQFTATGIPTIELADTKPADWSGFGYGDTVAPAVTFEVYMGRPTPESVVTTGLFYFRNRETNIKNADFPYELTRSMHDAAIFKVTENTVHFQLNTGVKNLTERGADICTLPEVGLVKLVFTIFSDGSVQSYYTDAEGNLVKGPSAQMAMAERFAQFNAAHQANLADEDPTNDTALLPYANFSNWFTMSTLNIYWNFGTDQRGKCTKNADDTYTLVEDADFIKTGTAMIDGVETPLKNADGTYNMKAIQLYAETHFSVLLDDLKFFGGAIYE